MTNPLTTAETEYRQARALVMDAMLRADANALKVAVSLHNDALDAIRREAQMSAMADKANEEKTAC